MDRNVYVGNRYVPKVMGEWDITKEYEPLMIVTHQGNSFTSKTFIPQGIDIQNESFWCQTANYNVQMANLKDDFEKNSNEIISNFQNKIKEVNDNFNNTINTINTNIQSEVKRKFRILKPSLGSFIDTFPSGQRITTSEEVKKRLLELKNSKIDEWIIQPWIVKEGNNLVCNYNTTDILNEIEYAKTIGITPICLKIHMYNIGQDDINQIGEENFKTQYKNTVIKLATALKNEGIYYCCVFNENEWLYLDSSWESFVLDVINIVKQLGYKTGISTMGIDNTLKLSNNILDSVDCFFANYYPELSNKEEKTTVLDIVNSLNYDHAYEDILYLKNKYNKDFIISEFGVMDYWACLNEPGSWDWDNSLKRHSNGMTLSLLLQGLTKSKLNTKNISRIWWCYDNLPDYQNVKDILNKIM